MARSTGSRTNQPLRPPRGFEDLEHYPTTNIAASGTPAVSTAFVGAWREGLLGIRRDLTIRIANDGNVGALGLTES